MLKFETIIQSSKRINSPLSGCLEKIKERERERERERGEKEKKDFELHVLSLLLNSHFFFHKKKKPQLSQK
jgi:LytS/YehU family sensor histidine kinase